MLERTFEVAGGGACLTTRSGPLAAGEPGISESDRSSAPFVCNSGRSLQHLSWSHYAIRLQNELLRPCSPRSLVAYASWVSKLPKSRIDEARLAHSIR